MWSCLIPVTSTAVNLLPKNQQIFPFLGTSLQLDNFLLFETSLQLDIISLPENLQISPFLELICSWNLFDCFAFSFVVGETETKYSNNKQLRWQSGRLLILFQVVLICTELPTFISLLLGGDLCCLPLSYALEKEQETEVLLTQLLSTKKIHD